MEVIDRSFSTIFKKVTEAVAFSIEQSRSRMMTVSWFEFVAATVVAIIRRGVLLGRKRVLEH